MRNSDHVSRKMRVCAKRRCVFDLICTSKNGFEYLEQTSHTFVGTLHHCSASTAGSRLMIFLQLTKLHFFSWDDIYIQCKEMENDLCQDLKMSPYEELEVTD